MSKKELSVTEIINLDISTLSSSDLDRIEKRVDTLIECYNLASDKYHLYKYRNSFNYTDNEYNKKLKEFQKKCREENELWQKKCQILLKNNPYIMENDRAKYLIEQAFLKYPEKYQETYDLLTFLTNQNLLNNDFVLSYIQNRFEKNEFLELEPIFRSSFFESRVLTSNRELVRYFIENNYHYISKERVMIGEKLYQEPYFKENPLELFEFLKSDVETYLEESLENPEVLISFANQIDAMGDSDDTLLNYIYQICMGDFNKIRAFRDNSSVLEMKLEEILDIYDGSKTDYIACVIMIGLMLRNGKNDFLEDLDIDPVSVLTSGNLPEYLRLLHQDFEKNSPISSNYDLWSNSIMTWMSNGFETTYSDSSFLRLFLSKEDDQERTILSCYLTIPEIRENILSNQENSLYKSFLNEPLDNKNHIRILTDKIFSFMAHKDQCMEQALDEQKLANIYYYKNGMMYYTPMVTIMEELVKENPSIDEIIENNSKRLPVGEQQSSILLDEGYYNHLQGYIDSESPVVYQKK